MAVEDLADHAPFPLYLQQMEEIGEAEAREVIGPIRTLAAVLTISMEANTAFALTS